MVSSERGKSIVSGRPSNGLPSAAFLAAAFFGFAATFGGVFSVFFGSGFAATVSVSPAEPLAAAGVLAAATLGARELGSDWGASLAANSEAALSRCFTLGGSGLSSLAFGELRFLTAFFGRIHRFKFLSSCLGVEPIGWSFTRECPRTAC